MGRGVDVRKYFLYFLTHRMYSSILFRFHKLLFVHGLLSQTNINFCLYTKNSQIFNQSIRFKVFFNLLMKSTLHIKLYKNLSLVCIENFWYHINYFGDRFFIYKKRHFFLLVYYFMLKYFFSWKKVENWRKWDG